MAGRGLVSGSLTTKSEGWMKRSGTLEEPSDCDFINLDNKKTDPFGSAPYILHIFTMLLTKLCIMCKTIKAILF